MGSVKLNRYTHRFVSLCPVNKQPILYTLLIETDQVIMVEDIAKWCEGYASAFHEMIADELMDNFGGKQTLSAHHHGVDIETLRAVA